MKYLVGLAILIVLAAGLYLASGNQPAGPTADLPPASSSDEAAGEPVSAPSDSAVPAVSEPVGGGAPDVNSPPTAPPPGGPAQPTGETSAGANPPVPTQPAAPPVREFTLSAKRFSFEPTEITVKLGEKVRLVATSTDVTHGLSLPQFNVSEVLPPGETKIIEFIADKRGRWPFACSVYCGAGHTDMKGAIIVE